MNDDEYKIENLPPLSDEDKELCRKMGLVPAGWHIAKALKRENEELKQAVVRLVPAYKWYKRRYDCLCDLEVNSLCDTCQVVESETIKRIM